MCRQRLIGIDAPAKTLKCWAPCSVDALELALFCMIDIMTCFFDSVSVVVCEGEKIADVACESPTFTVAWHPKRHLLAFACDDKDKYDRERDSGTVKLFGVLDSRDMS